MRRPRLWTGAATAALVAISLAPHASAASSAIPAPTLAITTTAAGHSLPASTMSGSWQTTTAGRDATLTVSGYAVSGTTTQITAVWYSSWRLAKRHKVAFEYDLDTNHAMILPGSPDNTWTYEEAWRGKTGGWHVVSNTNTDQYWLLGGYREILTDQASFERSQLMQWRVTMRLRLYDTAQESWKARVRVM